MSYILYAHIIAAILTLGISAYAWFRPSQPVILTMRLFTFLSVSSGIFLLADPAIFSSSYCVKLGLYLSFIALTEYRMHLTQDHTFVNPDRQK